MSWAFDEGKGCFYRLHLAFYDVNQLIATHSQTI